MTAPDHKPVIIIEHAEWLRINLVLVKALEMSRKARDGVYREDHLTMALDLSSLCDAADRWAKATNQ